MSKGSKPPKRGVSVASLSQPDKEGFLTKEGGSWKSWKRRWFVLKGDCLYYFKNQKDIEETGYIQLTPTSFCREEPKKGKKNCFSIFPTPDIPQSRQFFAYPDTPAEAQQWLNAINAAIERKKAGNASSSSSSSSMQSAPIAPVASSYNPSPATQAPALSAAASAGAAQPQFNDSYTKQPAGGGAAGGGGGAWGKPASANPRTKLVNAKDAVSFLQDSESKVLEFWQIWSESIPGHEELQPNSGMAIDYHVSVSANMQKLTWRTAGPQNIFIQKMVDFFWNVGAPESEIDRLNDVGALINPVKIGSWIDMSAKGGMDGGWYFPVEIPLKLGLEAADPGDPAMKLKAWADKYSIDKCFSVGRDMGAAPPRQTEFRLKVPGRDFPEQLRIAQDAYEMFGFPLPPNDVMAILRSSSPAYMCMSIITSSDGFVRLGLLCPKPNADVVAKLCTISGGPSAQQTLSSLEGAIAMDGPAFVEYQYLKEGFGYGVYKEGFDVVLHYELGEETGDD